MTSSILLLVVWNGKKVFLSRKKNFYSIPRCCSKAKLISVRANWVCKVERRRFRGMRREKHNASNRSTRQNAFIIPSPCGESIRLLLAPFSVQLPPYFSLLFVFGCVWGNFQVATFMDSRDSCWASDVCGLLVWKMERVTVEQSSEELAKITWNSFQLICCTTAVSFLPVEL